MPNSERQTPEGICGPEIDNIPLNELMFREDICECQGCGYLFYVGYLNDDDECSECRKGNYID